MFARSALTDVISPEVSVPGNTVVSADKSMDESRGNRVVSVNGICCASTCDDAQTANKKKTPKALYTLRIPRKVCCFLPVTTDVIRNKQPLVRAANYRG